MDTSRNDLLGEIAADAALERSDFLVQSTEQFRRFLDANKSRIDALGGLTLIDEDPDYLSIAPDLTFRSRTRYIDDLTGEWIERDRGHRDRRRAHRALQPGRSVHRLRRGGPRRRGTRPRADRRARPPRERRHRRRRVDAAGRGRGPVRRRRGRLGRRPARPARRRRRRDRRAASVRPRARVPGAQPAGRIAPARAVRGGLVAAHRADRRPDHQRRRGRAAHAHGGGCLQRGGPDRRGERVAAPRHGRPARRVLRPDRRLR